MEPCERGMLYGEHSPDHSLLHRSAVGPVLPRQANPPVGKLWSATWFASPVRQASPPVCAHLPICQQPFANTRDISLVILCVSFHPLPFPVPVDDLPFALLPSFLRHFSPSPCELPAAERIQLTDGHTSSATGFILNPCLLLSTFT